MKTTKPLFIWTGYIAAVILSLVLSSCSGSDGSKGRAGGESIYDAGASVPARGFDDSYPLELLVENASGSLVAVRDGQYVQPGKRHMAVSIEGDHAGIDRVFLSDGGVYQVEALRQGDLYACEFEVKADRLYKAILVQVIHTDGRASKEKVVVRTAMGTPDDALILDGIGLMVSQGLLDDSMDQLADVIDAMLSDIFACIESQDGVITRLRYGDNDPRTTDVVIHSVEAVQNSAYPAAVLRISLTVLDVDLSAVGLFGQDLITTSDNDLYVDAYLAIGDIRENGDRGLVVDLLDSTAVSFARDFFLRPVLEELIASGLTVLEQAPLATDIRELAGMIGDSMPMTLRLGDTEVDLVELFGNLDMDLAKYLFVDLYGIPEATSNSALALGAGLYVADHGDVERGKGGGSGSAVFSAEDAFMDLFSTMVDEAFARIKSRYRGLVTTLSYGDGNPSTRDIVMDTLAFQDTGSQQTRTVRARFTVRDVDLRAVSLFGFSLIATSDNDLTVEATCLLTHRRTGGTDEVLLDVQNVIDADFDDDFPGDFVVEELVKKDIGNMDTIVLAIDALVDDLGGAGGLSGCSGGGLLFPDVMEAFSSSVWEPGLVQGSTLGLALSQDMINAVLAGIFEPGLEWDVYEILRPLLGTDFAGFQRERQPGEQTIMYLSVPPVLDLRTNRIRMQLDDVVLEYRREGQPQWSASVDLDLILTVRPAAGALEFHLGTAPENCHFHIMRDNPGNLGVFDHSNLVNDVVQRLPELVGKAAGGPLFTVDLDALDPLVTLKNTESPVQVSAFQGYLYIDAAAESVDLSWVKGIFSAK